MIGKLSVVLFFMFLPFSAQADCIYNGKHFESGDIVNGYICNSEKNWEKYEE